jgi:hypothetical protein
MILHLEIADFDTSGVNDTAGAAPAVSMTPGAPTLSYNFANSKPYANMFNPLIRGPGGIV